MTNGKTCLGDARCRRMASNRHSDELRCLAVHRIAGVVLPRVRVPSMAEEMPGCLPRVLLREGVSLLRADADIIHSPREFGIQSFA